MFHLILTPEEAELLRHSLNAYLEPMRVFLAQADAVGEQEAADTLRHLITIFELIYHQLESSPEPQLMI
jgi:hypothetical protein